MPGHLFEPDATKRSALLKRPAKDLSFQVSEMFQVYLPYPVGADAQGGCAGVIDWECFRRTQSKLERLTKAEAVRTVVHNGRSATVP